SAVLYYPKIRRTFSTECKELILDLVSLFWLNFMFSYRARWFN
ncbi:unnamed protein product, partial [Callosobruchus maculatus]